MSDPQIAERTHGVIALSGVYDLRPAKLSFLQSELHLTDREVATHSLHPEEGRPPVLYVNGRDETYEFMRGSALMASNGRSAWEMLDGNHMSLTWQAVESAPELVQRLSDL